MNKIVLKESDGIRAIYYYYPDGVDGCGEVVYHVETKGARILNKAPTDPSGNYARRAIYRLLKVIKEENELPTEIIMA